MYACSRAGLLTIPLLPTQLLSPPLPPDPLLHARPTLEARSLTRTNSARPSPFRHRLNRIFVCNASGAARRKRATPCGSREWLGYPKSRNCWRSPSGHFSLLKGDDASLVLAARRRVQTTITAMAEEELEPELEGSGLVLIQGRQPINAREIRASSRWRRRASRTGLEAEAAAL